MNKHDSLELYDEKAVEESLTALNMNEDLNQIKSELGLTN